MSLYNRYIPESTYTNIKEYKFNSKDYSLIYKYVTSPLCDKMVEYFPLWLAPNVITVFGLFLVFIKSALVNYYSGPTGNGDIPGIVCILSGVLFYSYHILDLCDGKQARRTKNSSPLGMLVDHGCDTLSTFLLTTSFCCIVKLEGTYFLLLTWYIISFPFFLALWEENITGRLDLPIINGANEGNLIASVLMIVTAFIGQDKWLVKHSFFIELPLNQIVLLSLGLAAVMTTFLAFKSVFTYNSNASFKGLYHLLPLLLLKSSLVIVFTYSKADELINTHPKFVIYIYGVMYAKLLLHLMIAHISHSEFQQWRFTIVSASFTLIFISIWNTIDGLT